MTNLGKAVLTIVVLGVFGFIAWRWWDKLAVDKNGASPHSSSQRASASPQAAGKDNFELAETLLSVPSLPPALPYVPKDDVIEIELSEYAGYAGLIVANGGLEASPDSVLSQKYGLKLRIKLSEEESWAALNSGKMAASATTVDVLAVYGRQFNVVIPAQIGFSRGADGVVVRKDIKRINDLKGKTLISAQFTEADFFIRYLAQEAGLTVNMLADLESQADPEKLNLVYCTDAFTGADHFLSYLQKNNPHLDGSVTWAPKTDETVAASEGKAHLLTTNRNLLIIGDILIVNKGFAEKNPAKVQALVSGLIEGNQMVRDDQSAHLPLIMKAFGWTSSQAKEELAKIHFSNLPENLAFFSGAIDSAGSYNGIYQSALYAYGSMIKNPLDGERFLDLKYLKSLETSGAFKNQVVSIQPIRSSSASPLENDPLLTKNIRFLFSPNSAELEPGNQENARNMESLRKLLQISPGSTILLRGHVDNAMIDQFRKQGGESFVRQMALRAIELSKSRATSVRKALVEQYKIEPSRLESVGRGWEEPLGTDSEQNRRVEAQWFTVE